MKTYKTLLPAFLALTLLSCTKGEPQRIRHEILASAGDNATTVKSELNPTDATKVFWSAAEQVNVFVGNVSYKFTGSNAAAAAQATFTGSAPADLGTYVMLSPYNGSATKSSGTISTTLPAAQSSRAGSFIAGTMVLAGQSSTATVTCKHVCSGLRFMLTAMDDVSSVSISGNDSEKIAGDFSFSFDAGNPVVSAGGGTATEVVLTPSTGTYFAKNQWYYIAILPTTFSTGISLTATSASKGAVVLPVAGSLTFSRARFKSLTWGSTGASIEDLIFEDL